MTHAAFLPSDLPEHYRAILDQAKAGGARVRDADGTTILLLPEADVLALRRVSAAAMNLATVERAVEARRADRPNMADFGDWGWLQVLDAMDVREFVEEIREAIIVGAREGSSDLLDEQLAAWKLTAAQASDPLFRSVMRGGAAEEDFVEVGPPAFTRTSEGEHRGQTDRDGPE